MRLSVKSIKLLIALLEVTDSIGKLTAEVRSCGAVAHSPLVSPSPLMGCQRTSPAPLHPVLLIQGVFYRPFIFLTAITL